MQNQPETWPFPTGAKPPKTPLMTTASFNIDDLLTDVPDYPILSDRETAKAIKQSAKERKAQMLSYAKDQGIGLVHIFDTNFQKGGMTIAFQPSSEYKSCTMVKVAVATCSRADTFSKSIGTLNALEKFFCGDTIELPLLRTFDKEDLSWVVKRAFTALDNAI